jgi:hypothetical protein
MMIPSRINEGFTISGTKVKIKLDGSLNSALISERRVSKKILNVFFLGQINAIRGGTGLNPKKITKRTKIGHKKLLTETCLDKGNILRIIASDNHIINIKKKKKSVTMT